MSVRNTASLTRWAAKAKRRPLVNCYVNIELLS